MVEMETTGKIYPAMIAMMREIKGIGKDSVNKQQGFKFRGIDTVYNELHGLLAKHGVVTLPEVLEERSEEKQTKTGGTLIYRIFKMRYHFVADDGSSCAVTVMGEGMDSGDKASGKSMSQAHKYALLQSFLIPTDDIADPDRESYEVGEGVVRDRKWYTDQFIKFAQSQNLNPQWQQWLATIDKRSDEEIKQVYENHVASNQRN